jgi:hypothetical protein
MKSNEIIVRLPPITKRFYIVLGIVAIIATAFIAWVLYYSFFFEREDWLTRKNLLKWLTENELPEPRLSSFGFEYNINGLKLYLWNGGTVSLHDKDFVLSSFTGGYFDRRNYNKIKQILVENIGQRR